MTLLPAGNIAEKSCIWLRRFAGPLFTEFPRLSGTPRKAQSGPAFSDLRFSDVSLPRFWAVLPIIHVRSVVRFSPSRSRRCPGPPARSFFACWGGMAAIPAILASSQCLCGELVFRSPDHPMPRSPDLFASLCLRPSARDPTPHSALLKIKVQPQFDRAVTDRSKPFLRVFQGSNPAQFRPLFFVFIVRSAEGRKLFWPPVVICQGADFSKIFSLSPHPGMHYFSASPHTNQWRIRTSPWSALRVSMVGLLFHVPILRSADVPMSRFPDFPISGSSPSFLVGSCLPAQGFVFSF